MTCPDRPSDLDLLLAGEPTDPDVQAHAEGCATCSAEVALARQIDAAFAARRAVTAPPEVISAALAAARGTVAPGGSRSFAAMGTAANRPARSSGARGVLRVGAVAFTLALLAALSWTALRADQPDTAPIVAENETTLAAPHVPVDSADRTEPQAPETESPSPEVAPPQSTPPARRRATSRRESTDEAAPRPAPRQRRIAPAPEAITNTAPPPDLVAEAEPTPTEIEHAQAELQLAFALIADAQRQAGRAVRNETGALSTTLDNALPF